MKRKKAKGTRVPIIRLNLELPDSVDFAALSNERKQQMLTKLARKAAKEAGLDPAGVPTQWYGGKLPKEK